MEIREIAAFVAVAEELHFGRAADRLHMTQPPLSQRIKGLERQLGLQLFDRSTRNVRCTPEAEGLLPAAREVLESLDRFRAASDAMAAGESGRLRIGFSGASTSQVLPLLAHDIRSAYPNIDLVLNGYIYATTAQSMIRAGKLDLAFSRLPIDDPDIGHLPLETEELLCALPDTHPLASQKEVRLEDLASETFITFPPDTGSTLYEAHSEALRQAGITKVATQEATDSYTILSMVAAGAGVALTLSSVRHIQPLGVAYRPLAFPKITLRSALIWDSRRRDRLLGNVVAVCKNSLHRHRNLGGEDARGGEDH